MKNLTIVILTYNSLHVIGECLSKINLLKYKIVVVDNASSDGTTTFVEKNFSNIELIKLDKNVGYGNGNNVALNAVDTEFALVLNPDAFISEENIEKVLDVMKKDELVASAGPLIFNQCQPSQAEIANRLKLIDGDVLGARKLFLKKDGDNVLVRFVVGAVLFLRTSIFKKIGFFDKNIFLFYEDDELSKRAEKNGYKNIMVLGAKALHIEGTSSKISLKTIYRRAWHFNGWSKLYWKKISKGSFAAKRSAIRLSLVYFLKTMLFLLKFDQKKIAHNFGGLCGSLAFLLGMKSH